MILTVEEAAHEIIFKDDNIEDLIGNESYWGAAQDAFRLGAAWQKAQGIDWISVETGLPVIPPEKDYLRVLYIGYKNGVKDAGLVDFQNGRFQVYPTEVTYWAYFNEPKTD